MRPRGIYRYLALRAAMSTLWMRGEMQMATSPLNKSSRAVQALKHL